MTGTVESLDLITASILSKKLAAGLDGLVMDVKQGSGAFMATLPEARALAESIVTVAEGAGLRTAALITDMDAPLASAAGNAVEVAYAIDYLTGARREPRFHAVTLALGAEMLVAGGLARTATRRRGAAGGEPSPRARRPSASPAWSRRSADPATCWSSRHDTCPPRRCGGRSIRIGTVAGIATRAIGLAVIELGGGRTRPEDAIDPRVGFTDLARPGDRDGLLGIVHAADEACRGPGGGCPARGLPDGRGARGPAGGPRAGRSRLGPAPIRGTCRHQRPWPCR